MFDFSKNYSTIDPPQESQGWKLAESSDLMRTSPDEAYNNKLMTEHLVQSSGQHHIASSGGPKAPLQKGGSSSLKSDQKKSQGQVKLHLQNMPSDREDLSHGGSQLGGSPNRLLSKNSYGHQHQSYQNSLLPHSVRLNMSLVPQVTAGTPSVTVMVPYNFLVQFGQANQSSPMGNKKNIRRNSD